MEIPPSRRPSIIALFALASGIILLFLALSAAVDFRRTQHDLFRDAEQKATQQTHESCRKLNEQFSSLSRLADAYADDLEAGRYTRQEIESMIAKVMTQNPHVFGFCIAFKPYAFEPGTRLYAPYSDRKDGRIRMMQVEDVYDYTKKETSGGNWYVNPMNNGPGWTEPYFGSASNDLLAVYSVPFTAPGETKGCSGVVSAVYSIHDVKDIMEQLNLDSKGFGYLVSKTGTFLSHPNRDYVKRQENIQRICRQKGLPRETIELIMAGTGEVLQYRNDFTGRESSLVSLAVKSTGYVLTTVYDRDLMVKNKDFSRTWMIRISLFALSGISLFLVSWVFFRPVSAGRLWSLGIILSVLLVIEIGFIWCLALSFNPYNRDNSVTILDHGALKGFINSRMRQALNAHEEEFITIPTGVFVQSLEFDSANNVVLTGYVWQKYANNIPSDITRGFILPEAISANITEAYRRSNGEGETIGWYFEATLRQDFDYSRYPLDNKDVWLRLWHGDFHRNIILVPDIDSYQITDPKSLPGVEHDIVLSGWDIQESFFSYVHNSYNTDFGIPSYSGMERFPELYFTVIIKRKFINPFISNLLPFLVMSCILFGSLLLVYQREEKTSKFDSSVNGTLGACAALFFSVLIAHSGLRGSISCSGILYLEYFYFVMYGAIVIVAINAFQVAYDSRSFLITYGDNLITKLLYWPVILSVLLFVTVRTFY